MAKKPQTPAQDLTIYLLKETVKDAADAIRKAGNTKKFVVKAPGGTSTLGELFVRHPKSHAPDWAQWFDPHVDLNELGRVSSTSAAFIVKTNDRHFALTFGTGRSLLVPDCWEERFGLRTAVNSIKPDQLRSVDRRRFDALSTHARVQASKEGSAPDFGLDVEQDLVRAVTGVPREQNLGTRLTGVDSLHVSAHSRVEDIKPLLRLYLGRYEDSAYKKTFPWIDHIAEVTDKAHIALLDDALVKNIKGKREQCWLCVPEIIDWSKTAGFRYSFKPNTAAYSDLNFNDFLEDVDVDALDIVRLERRRVHRVNNEGTSLNEWTIYKCIYCELEQNKQTFVLSTGKWYKVGRDFVSSVNKFFEELPLYDKQLPAFNDDSEAAYCARVAAENPKTLALMDQKLIRIGGAHGSVEFCDLFSSDKDVIHIKRYGASGVLSHLFSQAIVSGQSFCSDGSFRAAAAAHLPAEFKCFGDDEPPKTSEYRYVFAVVSTKAGKLTLPFFSRVNLRHAAKLLQAFGYQTALSKISVAEELVKLKKLKPK